MSPSIFNKAKHIAKVNKAESCSYVVEKSKAGRAKTVLPIQMMRMTAVTTFFDVRTFKGQTMALYLLKDNDKLWSYVPSHNLSHR